ncbi:hypothetical protein LTR10_008571 [Elasticomyces elasticus]|uniref:BTB domain-containing protein n=1 Tax=Elasticomyces elasticus TaxID=574655 RepID=A0AAN7VPA0_9PEZI|nr:hypothetical protein LTR10_008571 [Elasticomyces elasticus]KAK4967444.1 hypothetical protein LTR42_010793 [Elasticomyces elasticus]KAK5694525.1 hypothetical protein LTR97_009115 [Elasticomyces elasticus]KAK5728272.1 hypothetical protein LTR15_001407 [Elasticomyces elasticus]
MAPPSTVGRYFTPETLGVTFRVIIGAKQESFDLDRGTACFYSGYFEAALKKDSFKEGKDGIVKLEEEDVTIFRHFVKWLYSGQLPITPVKGDNFDVLCDLWLLGDRRNVPLLQNQALDAIRDETVRTCSVPNRCIPKIYANTMEKAGLRCFVMHIVALTMIPTNIAGNRKAGWPEEAVWDVFGAVVHAQHSKLPALNGSGLAKIDMCVYHTHEAGVKCLDKLEWT